MLSKRILALSLAFPLLFLTGCGDGNTNDSTPSPANGALTPSTLASPVSSPAVTKETNKYKPATLEQPAQNVPVPKYPEAGKQDNKAGREAAADYFFEALLYAKETGGRDALDEVSYPECVGCWEYQSNAEKFYEEGAWVVGGIGQKRTFNETPGPDVNGQYQIHFKVIEDASTLRYSDDYGKSPKPQRKTEGKGILWIQYWPDLGKNVVLKYQTTSLRDLE